MNANDLNLLNYYYSITQGNVFQMCTLFYYIYVFLINFNCIYLLTLERTCCKAPLDSVAIQIQTINKRLSTSKYAMKFFFLEIQILILPLKVIFLPNSRFKKKSPVQPFIQTIWKGSVIAWLVVCLFVWLSGG